jgi:aspartate/tyrosine/aromatic aminotransferase
MLVDAVEKGDPMDLAFGEAVFEEAKKLAASGKDPNQIANILFQRDPAGQNYGIGIMLGGDGKPLRTSPTLMDYFRREIEDSQSGSYMNSAALIEEMRKAVLAWQRVPEKYWSRFALVLPSDAGTGAVQTAIEVALGSNAGASGIAVEALGWPAYKAIAKLARVPVKEFPAGDAVADRGIVPVYQSGPMNTTGFVVGDAKIQARAEVARKSGIAPVLDRAYSGFEFAGITGGYDVIMTRSYERQLAPFIGAGVDFFLALSPTKAFVTFALRPCGMLLFHSSDEAKVKQMNDTLNVAVRARGSSFEHPGTRAFVKAFVKDRVRLEKEHETSLRRVAEAEDTWRRLAKGTAIERYFQADYAGLFRNLTVGADAAASIYGEHLYPVLAQGRCRLNVTGIPDALDRAARHVGIFAKLCS